MSNGPECPYCACITEDDGWDEMCEEPIQCSGCEKFYVVTKHDMPTYIEYSLEEQLASKEALIVFSGGVGPIGARAVAEKQELERLILVNKKLDQLQ